MPRSTARCLLLFLLLLSLAAFGAAPPGTAHAAPNLLQNGDFSRIDPATGLPAGWQTDAWNMDPAAVRFAVEAREAGAGAPGYFFITLENLSENDSRWIQKVTVKPNTVYRLSGWIRAEGVAGGKGANLTVLGIPDYSRDLTDTGGSWEFVEVYGRTGKRQREVTVAARLGGYFSTSTGRAAFDDLRLEEAAPPRGVPVISFYHTPPRQAVPPSPFLAILLSLGAGFAWLAMKLAHIKPLPSASASPGRENFLASANPRLIAAALALGALLARALLFHLKGHPIDIACFVYWADQAARDLPGFYSGRFFVDYPPGYIYVLYLLGLLRRLLSLELFSSSFIFLVKLPAAIADAATVCLLYHLARRHAGAVTAFTVAFLYAANPAVILNSAIWGQVDSVFVLLVFLSLWFLARGRIPTAAAIFTAAVLVKPQALIFAPAVLFVLIRKKDLRALLTAAACSAAVFVALVLPFALQEGPLWIFRLFQGTLASYPYASVNAANLYALAGGNYAADSTRFLLLPAKTWGMIFIAAATALAAVFFFKSEHRSRLYYIAALLMCFVFVTVTKMHERYLFPALLFLLITYLYTADRRFLACYAGFTFSFLLNAGQVLALSYREIFHVPNNSFLFLAASLLNIILLLYLIWAGIRAYLRPAPPEPAKDAPAPPESPEHPDLALLAPENGNGEEGEGGEGDRGKPFLTRTDYLCAGALTLVYAVVALINLGNFQSPQTYYRPAVPGEYFVVDLGESVEIERMLQYSGIGPAGYIIELSADNSAWEEAGRAEPPYVFTWAQLDLGGRARYVKLTPDSPGGMLFEVAFFGPGGVSPLPVAGIAAHHPGPSGPTSADSSDTSPGSPGSPGSYGSYSSCSATGFTGLSGFTRSSGSTGLSGFTGLSGSSDPPGFAGESSPAAAVDEQELVPAHPSHMNSMYFDEIYHARTAYEHLHRLEPYETTHPPLGKVIISLGIALFGMTPFGWRIPGTLLGIAMVPLMFLFGKRLFGRTEYAFAAAFLMAFDFMHFTQTRIATIDTYIVFFIILMYYCMYRYCTTSFYDYPFRKTLVFLGLSGLFFGLGAACKWTGVYAGAGLAVLFCATLYRRYREYTAAKIWGQVINFLPPGAPPPERLHRIRRLFPGHASKTLAWCLLFFVAMPLVIYLLAYIPFMLVPGPGHGLQGVIDNQVHMYRYHGFLEAEHPFASRSWEWPIILRPIWYFYTTAGLPAGQISSISALGNPAVWWVGIAAVAAVLYLVHGGRGFQGRPPCPCKQGHHQVMKKLTAINPLSPHGDGPMLAGPSPYLCMERVSVRGGGSGAAHFQGSQGFQGDGEGLPVGGQGFSEDARGAVTGGSRRRGMIFVLVALAAQYLPWLLVTRLTFIYHFFTAVPFVIFCIVYMFRHLQEEVWPGKRFASSGLYAYLGLVLLLFVLFYPVLSGAPVNAEYVRTCLRWFSTWIFLPG